MTKGWAVLFLAAVVLYVAGMWLWQSSESEAAELRSELLLERARADSLGVRVAQEARTAQALLAEAEGLSSRLQGLGAELDAAEARNTTLTRLLVEAQGRTEAPAVVREVVEVVDTVEVAREELQAEFQDPPLEASLLCQLRPDPSCALEWVVRPQVDLVHAVLPDGRLAVFVDVPPEQRGRVHPQVDTLIWTPPPPERSGWWGLRRRELQLAVAVAVGYWLGGR